jgi:hypothetical protein
MGELFAGVAKAFKDGGPGMYPILVAFAFAVAIFVERISVLYFKAATDKETFLAELKKLIFAGDLDRAIAYCA